MPTPALPSQTGATSAARPSALTASDRHPFSASQYTIPPPSPQPIAESQPHPLPASLPLSSSQLGTPSLLSSSPPFLSRLSTPAASFVSASRPSPSISFPASTLPPSVQQSSGGDSQERSSLMSRLLDTSSANSRRNESAARMREHRQPPGPSRQKGKQRAPSAPTVEERIEPMVNFNHVPALIIVHPYSVRSALSLPSSFTHLSCLESLHPPLRRCPQFGRENP